MPNGFSQSGATIRVSGITHQSMSAIEAEADSGRVRPPEWNDDHVVTGGYHGQYMMRDTTAAVGWSFAGAGSAFIGAKAVYSTTQNVSTTAALTLDTEEFDTDNFWNSGANTRMTIPAGLGGKYLLIARTHTAEITASAPQSVIWLRKNGATVISGSGAGANTSGTQDLNSYEYVSTCVADLVAGEYVEVMAFSTTSIAFGHANDEIATAFTIIKLDSGKVGGGIGAKAVNTAGTSIANNTVTPIPYAATDLFDTDNFHDTVTNNTRMTVPAGLSGKYLIQAQVTWNGVLGTTSSYAIIKKNGTIDLAYVRPMVVSSGTAESWNFSAVDDGVAGDYYEIHVWQNSGSAKTLEATSPYNYFAVMRLDSGSQTNSIKFPTILQRAQNEASTTTTITATIAAANAGQRIILGAWSTLGDITSVACTNVTWTQMTNGNFSTTVYADIWVGVVTATSGTTITVTKGLSGGFMGVAVAVVNDLLTPTAVLSTSRTGTDANYLSTTVASLEAQTHVGKLFAAFAGLTDGTNPVSIIINQPHLTVYATSYALLIGYVSTGGTLTSWCTGTSGADFVNDLVIIS